MRFPVIFFSVFAAAAAADSEGVRMLDAKRHHLGLAGMAEWAEFEALPCDGPQLDLTFTATANPTEQTLFIWQRDVKVAWNVMLNGRKLGTLESLTQPLVVALRVPAGMLKSGENRLTIMRSPSRMLDDIVVGEITLDSQPREAALSAATLEIEVTDEETGRALPCRLTLTNPQDALMPLHVVVGAPIAVRTGVIYTGDGKARFGVGACNYVLHAGRGVEYSVATTKLVLRGGETKRVALRIRREVSTPGFIAADSHIHTLTYSKHGDATIEERMLTIAGEGIELAVATDHNHHADYTEPAARTGTSDAFRSVVGNEVTTKTGHFNAFPIQPGSALPDSGLSDWPQLLKNIRSVTGARVVTLNHPRDLHSNFTPFAPANFDAVTGALKTAPEFDCNAIEVVTSAAMQSDIMQLYRDWFALLNHGYRVAAIGASDTHQVSQFILGQARTYVASRATEPSAINMDEICDSYRTGRLLVSLGLFANMTVNDRFVVGDLVPSKGAELHVAVDVRGPSWTTADKLELFANGIKVREQRIAPTKDPLKARVTWTLPAPAHDVHLVAVATGPGVTAPHWEIPRPYQPTSKTFTPRIIGSTNPIWIDSDGDGEFTCARGQATQAMRAAGGDTAKFVASLARYDESVAVQAADLWAGGGNDLRSPELTRALERAPAAVQDAFRTVQATQVDAR
ncbi:MAG: CehA/McbA family metallohydrolase [Opitutaceae bacterium]|nr:CehA/McbA family metallohydrolase [Opitutaceae bacterium]